MQPEQLAEAINRALPPDFTIEPWTINHNRLVFHSMIHYDRHGKSRSMPIAFDYIELRQHPGDLIEYVIGKIRKACYELC